MKPLLGPNDKVIGALILQSVVYPANERHDFRRGCGIAALACFIIGSICAAVALAVNL